MHVPCALVWSMDKPSQGTRNPRLVQGVPYQLITLNEDRSFALGLIPIREANGVAWQHAR